MKEKMEIGKKKLELDRKLLLISISNFQFRISIFRIGQPMELTFSGSIL
jgi:hypothetical protein